MGFRQLGRSGLNISEIAGATRHEQVHNNAKAAGVRLEAEAPSRIDDVFGDAIERDPGRTQRV